MNVTIHYQIYYLQLLLIFSFFKMLHVLFIQMLYMKCFIFMVYDFPLVNMTF
jgi:hypothetical protein